ncbi:unnamed protein product [Coffea canephora]|uniref:UDP-glycosyltransferases domain-containing protein n=1 Tax=Coffea canephora TaxID=49390 RepID=A0A068UXX9_COFCA|nr:unnamed protein product [Coffea canephora]
MFDFMGEEAQSCLKAPAIIFNAFDEFETKALEAVISKFKFPNIYAIGPLQLLSRHVVPESQVNSLNSSLWKPDLKVFEWLDRRAPNSVVYVNYGSVTTMTNHHFREFAWGLATSRQQFLWIVRPNKVLEHSAIGVFLTHCGWNSMMETICAGVPVICWPFFVD